jgi:hypothetical protein
MNALSGIAQKLFSAQMDEFEVRGDGLPLMGGQCAKQMIAVQIGLKRKHDSVLAWSRVRQLLVFSTRPCIRLALPPGERSWICSAGPVWLLRASVIFGLCTSALVLRFSFSEDCASLSGMSTGATQRRGQWGFALQNVRFCFNFVPGAALVMAAPEAFVFDSSL